MENMKNMNRRLSVFLMAMVLLLSLAAPAFAAGSGQYALCWPVLTTASGAKTITSSLGNRTAPVSGASTSHKGIDIGVPSGSAVLCTADGVVKFTGKTNARGNYVVIFHPNLGLTSVYQHLSSYSVRRDQQVSKGEAIGKSGATGNVSGPHLHFELVLTSSAPKSVDCAWEKNAQLLDGHYDNRLITYTFLDHASFSPSAFSAPATTAASVRTDRYYTIKNVGSGKMLNVYGSRSRSGTNVTVYQADNTSGQDFLFIAKGGGKYVLEPRCGRSCALNVNGYAAQQNSKVDIWKKSGHSTQSWLVEYSSAQNGYIIRSADNPTYVLTATGSKNSSDVRLAAYNPSSSYQVWTSEAFS